jgi:hypothetical protein
MRGFSRLYLALGLAACCVMPGWTYARAHVLYRFDTRPPEEIFSSGFVPRGRDTDLIRHTLAWTQESAFIATTLSFEAATSFADTYLQANPDATGYIYRIDADNHFYEVMPSLEHFLERERIAGIDSRFRFMEATLELAIQQFSWQQEFVSVTPIAASSIAWAIPMRRILEDDGSFGVRSGSVRDNMAWIGDQNTIANTRDYPVTWPTGASFSSSPSDSPLSACSEASGAFSLPAGMNCTGDLYAAAEGGAEGGDPIHLALLPSCSPSPPQKKKRRKKRSDAIPACYATLRIVNVSNRVRVDAVIHSEVGEGEFWRW